MIISVDLSVEKKRDFCDGSRHSVRYIFMKQNIEVLIMTFRMPLGVFLATALALPAIAQQGKPGAHFLENWDLNEDGQVTVAEATEKRGDVFYMFDQDENGALDAAEYDLFDETRKADMDANAGGHRGPMRKVSQAMAREFNDVDKDGTVTEEEFLSQVPAWFSMMDRDGDEVLTSSDFGR